jgi:hypothetical protein
VAAAAVGVALAPGIARGAAAAGPDGPDPDPAAAARAFGAAWNAHDLEAVLAGFAPDAVVRERRGAVPAAVWDTRDPLVVRAYLDAADGAAADTHGLTWVTGRQQIAAWAAAHFARAHRFAAGPYRAAGATVGWPYREVVDPYQRLPGVDPTEGTAEAEVRGGVITRLTLVQSPASVQRRRSELEGLAVGAVTTRRAAPPGAGPSVPPREPRGAAEPTDATWPLALGGLAVLSAITVALRRRAPQR